MNIKGIGVKSVAEFVKIKFPERYQEWISLLPDASKTIFTNPIYVSNWYSIQDALVVPTQIIASAFYGNNIEQAALEAGRFSAEIALKGVYRIFLKVASPNFIINRATIVSASYYSSSNFIVVENLSKRAVFRIADFEGIDKIIEFRIKGWVEKAIAMAGAKNVQIDIKKSLTKNDDCSEFWISWE